MSRQQVMTDESFTPSLLEDTSTSNKTLNQLSIGNTDSIKELLLKF